jgi:lipopolysaccharide biosynthesis glycosyltransferase
MGVSLYSLYTTNAEERQLSVYVISNDIQHETKAELDGIARHFGREIHWIDFEQYKSRLILNMEWDISLSAYARLFLAEMLPSTCERVLYLDCDTIVCESLRTLWETDLNGKPVAGVMDLIPAEFKKRVGLNETDRYINSGVLLIDVNNWRTYEIQKRFIAFIDENGGRVTHHDQGVINAVLSGDLMVLSPKYNSMTPYFTFRYENMISFFRLKDYYSAAEVGEAKCEPVIIHYTPEFVGRPWEHKCRHPKTRLYRRIMKQSGLILQMKKQDVIPMKQRMVYWIYKKCPLWISERMLRGGR